MVSAATIRLVALLLSLANGGVFSFDYGGEGKEVGAHVSKRSLLTYPPSSVFQITIGIAVAADLERNSAGVVLGFQQNAKLPNDSQPFFYPPQVVSARQFSIFDQIKEALERYGFNGQECMKKMVCQTSSAPLVGGMLEELITFVLSPSKHRSLSTLLKKQEPGNEYGNFLKSILESEIIGKNGGNCSQAFPLCSKTPLDYVSVLIYS